MEKNKYKKKNHKNNIEKCPTYHVNINGINDIKDIIAIAKESDIWICKDLKNEFFEDWEEYDGLCIVIDLFQNTNNSDDYITSLDEIRIFPRLYFTDFNEGTYETISKEEFINIIRSYETHERLVKILNVRKEYLYNLINEYPRLSIGAEVITNLDIEYEFYNSDHFNTKKILGYTLIGDDWFIRTNSGYSRFNSLKEISTLSKEIRSYL